VTFRLRNRVALGLLLSRAVRDTLDNCCKAHDTCYGANGCGICIPGGGWANAACRECDRGFCRCMKLAACNRHPDVSPRVNRVNFRNCMLFKISAMGWFECEVNFGLKLPRPPRRPRVPKEEKQT